VSAIKQIEIGYIGRNDAVTNEPFEPTDEALIFLNDDNEQTIHIEAPNAKEIAAEIILAVRTFLPGAVARSSRDNSEARQND
jgi:hypothetical protein